MFQTRFKETNGVRISMKACHVIQKKQKKMIKSKEEQCYCQSAKDVFKFLFTLKLYKTFPNLYRLYQLSLTIPVTTAETERSFSKLKLIKTHQISTMKRKRIYDLAVLSIDWQISIDFGKAIDIFASLKNRRKDFTF